MKRLKVVGVMLAMVFVVACEKGPEVTTEDVSYSATGVTMKGFLAYDVGIENKRPGIIVVHEWWGHNEYARRRARMLAELGYTALAVDMYGAGKQAAHPGDAMKFSSAVMKNMPVARARFQAALNVLKKHPTVDPENIAAIGYCFGGGVVLQMAREGLDLDGVVSFHGSLATSRPARPGRVKARVLVLHGADDSFVTPEQVTAFTREMEKANVRFELESFAGAKHAFTNPEADAYAKQFNIPLAYNAKADKQSWKEMQAFFEEIFGKQ